jgi:hypothetical protein
MHGAISPLPHAPSWHAQGSNVLFHVPFLYLHIKFDVFLDHVILVRFGVFEKIGFGDKRFCANAHVVFLSTLYAPNLITMQATAETSHLNYSEQSVVGIEWQM